MSSLTKQLSMSALKEMDVEARSWRAPMDPPGPMSTKPSWRGAHHPKRDDSMIHLPSKKPPCSVAPPATIESHERSLSWTSRKGKGRVMEYTKPSLVVNSSWDDSWRDVSSDGWGRVGSQRSSSRSSWFFAESQDGWSQPDSVRSWGTEAVTSSSEDWEGCSSVWLNQPSASKTSEFVSIGLERTSSSKRPRPLSPENDRQSWKWKYPADDTLLSSILVKYRKDYLEAPLPLTTIQNDACLAHPYLSPQNPGQATWNDQYLRCAIIRFPDVHSEVKF